MSGPDDEFDDFLSRRKPVFRRSTEDPFEPPEELDRIVLRQAREAIESERPERMYQGPRWGMPVALAASLLLVFTIVLHLGAQQRSEPVPEVTVQTISQQIEYPAATSGPMADAPTAPPAASPGSSEVVTPMADLGAPARAAGDSYVPGGFASQGEGSRYAPAPPPPPRAASTPGAVEPSMAGSRTVVTSAPPPGEAEQALASDSSTPAWRRSAAAWQAEINRLRAEGKHAEADLEQAEFKRQHRAYAGSPDR